METVLFGLFMYAGGFVSGGAQLTPVPYYLTDACHAQTVKAQNGNYSYTSYEHCLNK